jgi:hypothetical protein
MKGEFARDLKGIGLQLTHNRHRWMPEQKEWVKDPEAQKSLAGKKPGSSVASTPIPHFPRSLQAEPKPRAGLRNLLRVL